MLKIEDSADGIRCIGLNRPDKRNAIGVEMTLALEDVLLKTKTDSTVKAIVFHGLGGHFCAGMDMKDFFDSSTRPTDVLQRARAATEHWRIALIRQMPQKIFTAVEGYCLGGGLPILAASTAVVVQREAKLGLPEINFGFVAGGQILKAVGEVMSPRGLAYATLTGRPFNAEQAQRWGLVTQVVESNPFEHALILARTSL
ncbi:MAG: enoyl-CoA hydratase/isomerase family protein [Betaproteobacteria bacterium]|nr:enoyl-CoA hydratase/isomerase family protein [Betaproteobacteria bacterium]